MVVWRSLLIISHLSPFLFLMMVDMISSDPPQGTLLIWVQELELVV